MDKRKTIRIVVILITIIVLALLARFYYDLDQQTVIAAMVGGAIGAFFGLLLSEFTK